MAHDPHVRRLLALFEKERDALKRGDLRILASLHIRKEALAERINLDALLPEDAQALGKAAARNQGLLGAARQGLIAARDRIAAIRAGTPIRTYSAYGGRQDIAAPPPTVQRRA